MARLRDLIQAAPQRPLALPPWLDSIVMTGVVSKELDVRRRQMFANIGAYAVALNASSHMIIIALYDFWGLLPINIYNLIITFLALLAPRFHRYGENAAAIFLFTVVWIGHTYVVFAFGLNSNLQVYFTLAGFMLFVFGVRSWRLFLVFYSLAFAAMLFSLGYAPYEGLVAPEDDEFRDFLSSQALITAIIMNALLIAYVLTMLHRAELDLARQHARSEALIRVMLPEPIAARLKSGSERRIADRIPCATVLFADLVGFTPAAGKATPEEVVGFLDSLVFEFDERCARHGVDKIKTMGDAYMAVGGLRGDETEGAVAVGRLALDMLKVMEACPALMGHRMALRVGVHCGPVIAGVIGDLRVAYDIWGDAVNVAQRMEAHGTPGRIQASEAFRERTSGAFLFEPRGSIEVKGVGNVSTSYLVAEGNSSAPYDQADVPPGQAKI